MDESYQVVLVYFKGEEVRLTKDRQKEKYKRRGRDNPRQGKIKYTQQARR